VQSRLTVFVEVENCDACRQFRVASLLGSIAGLISTLVINSDLASEEQESFWYVALIGLLVNVF